MKVTVLSAGMVIDERYFRYINMAEDFASEQQDAGFKVRLEEVN